MLIAWFIIGIDILNLKLAVMIKHVVGIRRFLSLSLDSGVLYATSKR
ncbi:MAG: hypothetical protein QXY40_08630 [Candidatus Methanomethylicia archaeon]